MSMVPFPYEGKDGQKITFYRRDDMSGDVRIVKPNNDLRTHKELTIPSEAILELVADFVMRSKISALEGADTKELLGIEGPT